jgi:predicted transcriptional regulator
MKRHRAESRKGMIVTTIALGPELHHRLAIAAVEENAAITELVREAVAEWLTRRDVKTKSKTKKR